MKRIPAQVLNLGSLVPDAPWSSTASIHPTSGCPGIPGCGLLWFFYTQGQSRLQKSVTQLIHPGWAGSPKEEILSAYHIPMVKLTKFALAHMRKLANATVDDTQWDYGVALESKISMQGPNTGISTAYFSIPKNNQFMPVCQETKYLAKQTFIYEAQKLCYSVTHKPVMKRAKGASNKRDRKGKFLATSVDDCADPSVGESGAGNGAAAHDLLS